MTMANAIVATKFEMFDIREIHAALWITNVYLFSRVHLAKPLGCLVFIFADDSLSGYKYSEFILYEVGHQ